MFVRRYAASALGTLGDVRAVEPLLQTLADPSDAVRMGAATALGKIGDARAVEPLLHALADSSFYVRQYTAKALGEIGDGRAVEPLLQTLRDENGDVRRRAAEALIKIGIPSVGPLCRALKEKQLQSTAREALEQIGDKDNLPRRILLAADLSIAERGTTLEAMREARLLASSVRAFCQNLKHDPDPVVREAARAVQEWSELGRASQAVVKADELVRPAEAVVVQPEEALRPSQSPADPTSNTNPATVTRAKWWKRLF